MKNNLITDNKLFDYLIIGFGISGITCSINILNKQPDAKIAVIELRDKYGGVWNDALETSCLQTDRKYYKLCCLEYPKNTSNFPNKNEMLLYYNLAINEYNLKNKITFFYNFKALSYNKIIFNTHNVWQVNTKHIHVRKKKFINTKNLLFCTGRNNNISIPQNLNFDILKNENVIHSKNVVKSLKLLNKANKIAIIGNGASGCDILNYIYKLNDSQKLNSKKEITMIYKSNKYFVDRYIGGISGSFILSKPFMNFFENCPIFVNTFLVTLANIFVFKNYLDLPDKKINSENIVGSMIINKLLKENTNNKSRQTFTYLNETVIDIINSVNGKLILKTDNSITSDLDLLILATGYNHIYPINFTRLFKYTIPINSDWAPILNVGFFGMNPRYNFIAGVENQIDIYLDIYKDNLNLNDKMSKSTIKQWIEKTQSRKSKNKLDFMDCTYELFEKY